MMLNCDEFPLVYVEDHDHAPPAPGEPTWKDELEALLGRNRPFVVIFDDPHEHEHEDSQDDRRERAIWFKQNRARMTPLCAGAMVIERSGPTSMPVRLAAQAIGKVLGIEFGFVGDDGEARRLAAALLARKSPAA